VAEGWGVAGANSALDAANTAHRWVQLHTGAPGPAGTANVAANATRKQATDTSAAGGAATTTADLTWSSGEVTTNETYTHYTRWSASSGGSFGYSGTLTAGEATAGQPFTLPAADLDCLVPLAS
jgi:hypothetical protein